MDDRRAPPSPSQSDASSLPPSADSAISEEDSDGRTHAPLDYSLKIHARANVEQVVARERTQQPPSPPPPGPDSRPGSPEAPQQNGIQMTSANGHQGPTHGDMADGSTTTPVKLPNLAGLAAGVNPALLAAGLHPGLAAGVLPQLNPLLLDPRAPAPGRPSKQSRPFKQYPKDALSLPLGYLGIPGMLPAGIGPLDQLPGGQQPPPPPPAPQLPNIPPVDELYKRYRELMQQAAQDQMKLPRLDQDSSSPESSGLRRHSNGGGDGLRDDPNHRDYALSSPETLSSPPAPQSGLSPGGEDGRTPPGAAPTPQVTTPPGAGAGSSRKRGRSVPEEGKTDTYWERRRRNNEAAKRSRDARRAKEDEIAIRAAFLEQENLKLRVEVASLKNETAKLRCMLYNS